MQLYLFLATVRAWERGSVSCIIVDQHGLTQALVGVAVVAVLVLGCIALK